ncbi:MAG: DUF1501 domain-containing protein [Rubrivivax sp.]|jgi:uncharacterized protein (DUF1501 family)|nr:DUF1501 domain-containing protein [Rubrivivax sp.]
MNASRRSLLRATAALGTLGPAAPLALSLAGLGTLSGHAAAAGSGYRALVCLFMHGGNDAHNWVVPFDANRYATYAQQRGALALPASDLTEIRLATSQGDGRRFAMPSMLAPLRELHAQRKATIVANVGPLLRPLTRSEALEGRDLPPQLFSHNDQASTWQSLSPEGARSGWGGRMGDLLMSANAQPVFTAVTASGNAVFLAGDELQPYKVGETGPLSMRALGSSWVHGSSTAGRALRSVLAASGTHPMQRDLTALVQRSIDADLALRNGLAGSTIPALPATPIALPGGGTLRLDQDSLARQLAIVARIASAHATMGMQRQVFFVGIGGWDTHSGQPAVHPVLSARVAHAVRWFHDAIEDAGLGPNVMLFTASEFGRTLVSNGDGSDHGWGAHHFVVGGGVRGGDMVGRFPSLSAGSSADLGSGRLLPTTAVLQLAATCGRWLGLGDAQLLDVLPGLDRFATRTLPFV